MARLIVVCFAVKEEARFFKPDHFPHIEIQTVITGMGARNAEGAIRRMLGQKRPALVLTCGFAGALNRELKRGNVIFAVDGSVELNAPLLSAGAMPGVFHLVSEVITTRMEKQKLLQSTAADAVEMESEVICRICRAANVPCGTVRVILDTADEDLPLNFNQLMTREQRLHLGKLLWVIAKAPGKIPALIQLGKQSKEAAEKLGRVLNETVRWLEGR